MSTKINVVVDGAGLPIRLALTPGQASDKEAAVPLIASLTRTRDLIADRGYDAQALIDLAQSQGARAHIPTQRDRKAQRSVAKDLYRRRNLVERFFNKLKHFRAVATRYDKRDDNFLAGIKLASARIWMRFNESIA